MKMNNLPKCYLLSNNQHFVVEDMFGKELSKNMIALKEAPSCPNNNKQYHLFYYEQDSEIDWWLSYCHPPRLFDLERSCTNVR